MTCADTRRRLHRSDDDPPARLPDPEKESRRKRLSNKLVGIEMEGDLDLAHCLIDLAYEAWEKNRMEFIPWDEAGPSGVDPGERRQAHR